MGGRQDAGDSPVTFRRPARYLNDGVPDFERDLALDGTALFASVKSSAAGGRARAGARSRKRRPA